MQRLATVVATIALAAAGADVALRTVVVAAFGEVSRPFVGGEPDPGTKGTTTKEVRPTPKPKGSITRPKPKPKPKSSSE
jgi:hypothetical protein